MVHDMPPPWGEPILHGSPLRSRVRRIAFWLLLSAGAAVAPPTLAESPNPLLVGAFSEGTAGAGLPENWRPLTFPKIARHTRYALVTDGDRTVVRAVSESSASGLIRQVRVDLNDYPILQWRWKVSNLIEKGDVRRKDGDDYAARIYITFEYDPDKVGFFKKAKYKAGRLIFGDIPIAAINYIWDGKTTEGTIVENAYTDFVRMIVVESGQDHVGRWIEEERNLLDDYRKAFGEDPPLVNAVAIMTDTDNTGEAATAHYGDILFKKAR